MLRGLAQSIRPYFVPAGWLIVDGDEIVGLASLVRQPGDAGIDIGFGIAPTRRRRRFATAAVRNILEWARADDRVVAVRGESAINNPASQRVFERNGFVRTGQRVDPEDGPVIRWEIVTG